MKPSTRNSKRILAVDDDPDLLEVLEEEILAVYPDFKVEKVHRFWQAAEKMTCLTYDAVILDMTNHYGSKLLQLAQSRHLPVGLLTAYPIPRPTQMAARAVLSKERLGDVVPFLEKIMDSKNKHFFSLKGLFRRFVRILGKRHLKPGVEPEYVLFGYQENS